MNDSQRAHFQALLEGERERILTMLMQVSAVPAARAAAAPGEESEPGTAGAAPVDDTALIARESASLADVERALQLLRDEPEAYGVCAECGAPISPHRLELVPTTRLCARHAR